MINIKEEKFLLDIIYVNYFSSRDTISSINSLIKCFKNTEYNYSIKIFDNSFSLSSKKDVYDLIEFSEKRSNNKFKIEYLPSINNLGFGKGCNIASKGSFSEFILFINCDTDLKTLDFNGFLKLLNKIKGEVVIAGPKIIDSKGLLHASCFSFDPISIFLKPLRHIRKIGGASSFIPKYRAFKKRIDRLTYEGFPKDVTSNVDWLSGCFLLVKRDFLKKLEDLMIVIFYILKMLIYVDQPDKCLS